MKIITLYIPEINLYVNLQENNDSNGSFTFQLHGVKYQIMPPAPIEAMIKIRANTNLGLRESIEIFLSYILRAFKREEAGGDKCLRWHFKPGDQTTEFASGANKMVFYIFEYEKKIYLKSFSNDPTIQNSNTIGYFNKIEKAKQVAELINIGME